MFDNEIMFRSGSTTLTADEAGTFVAYPKCPEPMELRVVVPSLVAGQTADTIVVTVTLSEDGTNAAEVITMPTITYAQVVTNHITEFFFAVPMTRPYIKVGFDITDASGSDFTAGKVQAGLVPAGRYTVRTGY